MKRHKILENDQYNVWITAKQSGSYTHVTFDVEQPNKKGIMELKQNAFQLYMLPSQLREFAAFLHSL
jgi:hypothetical protein